MDRPDWGHEKKVIDCAREDSENDAAVHLILMKERLKDVRY